MDRNDQYQLVYAGIAAVAANCDGAMERDGVGFNGQDTKFGRRIAMVPFEDWTDAVKEEAARISLTYRQQILAYTGVDVAKLDVVREANDFDTNHQARDDARTFERRAAAAENRRCFLSPEQYRSVWFRFDFDAEIKDALKAQGAKWNGHDKVWWIGQGNLTPAVIEIARKWFKVERGVELLFEAAESGGISVKPAAPAKPAVHGYVVNDQIVFSFPYNPGQKDAIKAAGARWESSDKTWRVRVSDPKAAAVVAAARQVGLTVAKEVDVAIGGSAQAEAVKLDRRTLLLRTSTVSRPGEVDPQFEQLVMAAVGR